MLDPIALLQSLTLPAGAISGQRIVLDGTQGNIRIYDANNHLVVLIDPVGFIELFSTTTGNLIGTMDDQGFTSYAAATTGLRTARLQQSGLFIYDVNGDISGVWDDTGIGLQVVPTDLFFRHKIGLDGLLGWGSGAAARDTNLYRASANVLQTDDTFNAVIDVQRNGISLPRGVMAYTDLATSDVARAAGVNTDMAVSFTADAARLYEIHFKGGLNFGTAGINALEFVEGGTVGNNDGTSIDRFMRWAASEAAAGSLTSWVPDGSVLYFPTAGSKTIRVANDAGSVGTIALTGSGTIRRQMWVVDIGAR
jgi:hypothetical protein